MVQGIRKPLTEGRRKRIIINRFSSEDRTETEVSTVYGQNAELSKEDK